MKMSINEEKRSSDEEKGAYFLKELEDTMEQIRNGKITMQQGYEKLIHLMKKKDVQQVVEIKARPKTREKILLKK
jgi:hypothetical protein